MDWLIWGGAVLTLIGVGLLAYCIAIAIKARKQGGSDAEVQARLQKLVALNMLALVISAMGLGGVTIGIILS